MRTTDSTFSTYGQGCMLVQIHRTDTEHNIRVRIKRDHYAQQSYAVAEVLTPVALTWTTLVEQPASKWHPFTVYLDDHHNPRSEKVARSREELSGLAATLLTRAVRILTPGQPPTTDEVAVAEARLIEDGWKPKHVRAAASHFLTFHADPDTQRQYVAFLLRAQRGQVNGF